MFTKPMTNKALSYGISIVKNILFFAIAYLALSAAINFFRAPTFDSLTNITGDTLSGECVDLHVELNKQKPVLIYVWGSWCPVCKTTSPTIDKFVQNQGVNVVSVASLSGTNKALGEYMQNKKYHHLPERTINDESGAIMQELGVQVTPTMVLAKQNGDELKTQVLTGYRSGLELKFRLWLMNR